MSRREGTLYARMGLQLVHHHRAVEAGESAMGVYMFCVLYSRLNELDGDVPRAVAERCWTGNVRTNQRLLRRLCQVGLLRKSASEDGGYTVLGYAEFNETREGISERLAKTRARVTRYRGVSNAVVPVSVSVSDLNIQEGSESQAPPAPPSAESAPPFPQTPPPAPRPIGPAVGGMSPPPADVELDDDLRARCFAAGVRMATKADVAALLDHARDKGRMSADWRAALVAWVRRSPQFERAGNPGFTKPDSPKNATPGAKATAAMLRKRDATEAAQPDVDIAEMLSKFGT